MANDRLLVSVPEMEAAIQRYENARGTLEDAFKQLESAKDVLDDCYKGPAYLALCAKWTNVYTKVRTAEKAIDETVEGLSKTINEMEQVESNVSSTSAALDVSNSAPTYL